MNRLQELTLTRGMMLINKIDNDFLLSYYDGHGDLVFDIADDNCDFILNMHVQEVSEFATASCGPKLWLFRTWAAARNIPVRLADWFWYNRN